MADYNKVGVLIFNEDAILMCRKNNTTSKLILPGGCIEQGESHLECLHREVHEELGNDVELVNLVFVGTYEDIAASDDPTVCKTLEIQLCRGELIGTPTPSSEITELVWFGRDSDPSELTPIFINKILPDLRARRMISW